MTLQTAIDHARCHMLIGVPTDASGSLLLRRHSYGEVAPIVDACCLTVDGEGGVKRMFEGTRVKMEYERGTLVRACESRGKP